MRTIASSGTAHDLIAAAHLQTMLRFATGITLSFVVCEYMEWTPAFLAPLLVALLITSLPASPPLKVGIALVVVMAAAAYTALLISTLLHNVPAILVGVIGVIVFLTLGVLAHRRAQLPATLMLICIATIPVIGMLAPAYADKLPRALVRGMAVAIVTIWCVYAVWPKVLPNSARPVLPPIDFPVRAALAGTIILLPVILVYLLFGWADALPVLISIVLLVTNFDPKEGATQGVFRSVSVVIGGLVGLVAFLLLSILPSLTVLALITFVIGLGFAPRIEQGGAKGAVALLAFNTCMVIFGSAIASPDDSTGIWMTRLFQFTLAGLFAVAMMILFFRDRGERSVSR